MGGLRDKVAKAVVGILIGLMVASFAVWGMEDVFQPSNRNAVVTLGSEPIESLEFRDAFRREVDARNRERTAQGLVGLTNEEAYAAGIHNEVLGQMITEKVLKLDAEDLGIGVDDRLARRIAEDMDAFRNSITGELDLDQMDRLLRSNNLTREQFEQSLLEGLQRQQILPAVVEGIDIPRTFAEQRFRYLSEQRRADVITLGEASVEVPADPDEATLEAWIADNERLYTAPEFRRFELLRVEPFDIVPDLDTTEEQVEDHYQYLLSLSPTADGAIAKPETRDVVQLQADDEAGALEAVARLDAGEDAAAVAEALGLDLTRFDEAQPGSILDPKVSEAAFEMEEGEARTVLGSLPFWYAVAVEAITPAVRPSLEEVREQVEADLLNATAEDRLFDVTGAIEDAMDSNRTFDEIADEQGLVLQSYDFVDRTGRTEDGLLMSGFSTIPGVATDDEILREVFTNDIGYETDLFETSNGGYFAVRVLDVKEAARRPMEDIRERAVADWKTAQVEDALQALAVSVQSRLRAGESPADVAAELDADREPQIIVRTQRNPAVGDELAVGLLDGRVGDVVRGRGPDPLTRQVAVLERITANTDRLAGRYADTLNSGARNEVSSDIQAAYRQSVLAENPVEENTANIRSTLGLDTGS